MNLITSDAVKEVLLSAKAGKPDEGRLNAEALRKCRAKGWIQGGDDESLTLTAEGRKACEALKL